jgi:arsenate reductase-like glutaredoxin family protein
MKNEKQIVQFCNSVKSGFGTIVDCIVKTEYERLNESKIDSVSLAALLALLEKHNLLDKKNSVNVQVGFYQDMYKKIKIENV